MTPKAGSKAAGVAVVLALSLCVAGIVAGREALIAFGVLSDPAWIEPAIEQTVGATAQTWMPAAGAAACLVGLVLLVVAILPRRRTHRSTGSEGVWIGTPRRGAGRTRGAGGSIFGAFVDRTATAVVGAVAVAVGALAVGWERGALPEPVSDARRTVETWSPNSWADAGWWPWALTAVAAVAVVLGLRWLFAHRPRRQPSRLTAENDTQTSVDLVSAARNAAAHFEKMPGIDSATSRVIDVRGVRILRVTGAATSDMPTSGLIDEAAQLRTQCSSALAGLPVEIQVLIDLTPAR